MGVVRVLMLSAMVFCSSVEFGDLRRRRPVPFAAALSPSLLEMTTGHLDSVAINCSVHTRKKSQFPRQGLCLLAPGRVHHRAK